MSGISTKVRIQHVKGAMIASFTDFEVFSEMGLPENTEFKNHQISIGDKIRIEEKEYTVRNVFSIIHNQTWENSGQKGFSAVVAGERYAFNFEIVYYVD